MWCGDAKPEVCVFVVRVCICMCVTGVLLGGIESAMVHNTQGLLHHTQKVLQNTRW